MKRFLSFLLLTFCCFAPAIAAQDAKQTKPVVMILGTYHMGNPGLDLNNPKADDVRAENRQKELAEFTAILKKFKPTKIAVEFTPEETKYLERYAQYLDGKYELGRNEVDQIGFRLAKEMNHKRLYFIDHKGNFDFDKVRASAKANGQEEQVNVMLAFGKAETKRFEERQKTATITELLREMNDERKVEEMHQPYMAMLRIGAGTDFAGANLVSDWYERNMKIYANIARLADSPNERILVIIGAGHTKLLQQFTTEAGELDLERLSKYL